MTASLFQTLTPRRALLHRLKLLAGEVPPTQPWCAHVALAMTADLPLDEITSLVGREPLRPAQVTHVLARVGHPPAILSGEAFALCRRAHRDRATTGRFRAIGIDLRRDPTTQLAHAVYLEDDWIVDPATYQIRRATRDAHAALAYIIIPQPRLARSH